MRPRKVNRMSEFKKMKDGSVRFFLDGGASESSLVMIHGRAQVNVPGYGLMLFSPSALREMADTDESVPCPDGWSLSIVGGEDPECRLICGNVVVESDLTVFGPGKEVISCPMLGKALEHMDWLNRND